MTATESADQSTIAETDAADTAGKVLYAPPLRRVITLEDLERFIQSEICHDFESFIGSLSAAVRGLPLSHPVLVSKPVSAILALLDNIDRYASQAPPQESPESRYGNPAFRLFYDTVRKNLPDDLKDIVRPPEAIAEVLVYLEKSFGDRRRIDYGTGHEANFMFFLFALTKLGVLNETDKPATVLRVFSRYLRLMKRLQSDYWLEPAGSHGVWGLDDYHSLPFLFGASQLIGHRFIRPRAIHDEELVEEYSPEYMYLDSVRSINLLKSVSLKWHSPMLNDISGVRSWQKIEGGMRRMYAAEVLGKLPIAQHLLFGSILVFENVSGRSVSDEELEAAADGHLHVYAMGQQFPACCGLRLPSAHAAKQHEKMRRNVLPFD